MKQEKRKPARVVAIDTDGNITEYKIPTGDMTELESMQRAVGGPIEFAYTTIPDFIMILHEEGKLLNMERNRYATRIYKLNKYDDIAGTAIIGRTDAFGFVDLTDEDVELIAKKTEGRQYEI